MIANKVKIHRDEALALARQAQQVWVAKGKNWLKFDLSAGAADDEICKAILGRSGTLRAPAMRVGEIFVVGFPLKGYSEVFGV